MEYDIEEQLRIQALSSAVGHRQKGESAQDVVQAAERYLEFLRAKTKA